ncbi:TVP38/TMEM64 family protein [Paenibacillus gorillae]|uniref:TVP38/TMEM64 family protein n=1 Tax=Paenibacillus gorillae TaxID=1243662 RepID=UPI0005A77C03|nr:VTT domain-containing protein [Paenibacillus gorillae]
MKYFKWYVFSFYLILIFFIINDQEAILHWIRADENGQFWVIFICAIALATIPFIPFGIVGAIIGAKYGFFLGGAVNLAASSIAAVLTYLLFNSLFRKQGLAYSVKSGRIQFIERSIRNNTFWSVFIGRLIPVMPAFLINCYAGTFKLAFKPFLAATVLGKIPAMLVFAYIGDNAITGAKQWLLVLSIYGLFILIIFRIYKLYMSVHPKN